MRMPMAFPENRTTETESGKRLDESEREISIRCNHIVITLHIVVL